MTTMLIVDDELDMRMLVRLVIEMANNGPEDSLEMGTFGLYEDELERVDGRWLLAKRRVLNDFIPGRNSGPENPVREMDALAEAFVAGQ